MGLDPPLPWSRKTLGPERGGAAPVDVVASLNQLLFLLKFFSIFLNSTASLPPQLGLSAELRQCEIAVPVQVEAGGCVATAIP